MQHINLSHVALVAGSAVTIYLLLIRHLKQQRDAYMNDLANSALEQLGKSPQNSSSSTDSSGTVWRVHNLLTANELRYEAFLAMSSRGLLMTYAIPSISSVLVRTGGFSKDISRRYADMELLIREFNENAADGTTAWNGNPARAKLAIQRLNAIHNQYGHLILYRDMLYVLSVFMCTGSLWSKTRWSSRPFTCAEDACVFQHWMGIGRLMNLQVDDEALNWKTLDDVVRFKYAYEAARLKFSPTNKIVVDSTINFFLQSVPTTFRGVAKPLIRHVLSALQDKPEHAYALGLPSPPNLFVKYSVDFALTLRAVISRYLSPPYSVDWVDRLTSLKEAETSHTCPFKMYTPTRNLDFGNKTYSPTGPGYVIEQMGPSSIERGLLVEKPSYYTYSEKAVTAATTAHEQR